MSLQVWLPLNGDTKNYGLANTTITNNGATSNSSGKIGSCYSFNGSSNYLTMDVKTSTTMSFCCWVYFTDFGSGTQLIDCRNSSGTGYQPTYINSSTIQIGNSQNGFTNLSYSFSTSKWYHIAVTYDENKARAYINGDFVGESANSGYDFGTLNITIGARCSRNIYFLNGKLNDIRIYDHCLSAEEIKELSQALVLHYPLRDPEIEPTENIDPLKTATPNFERTSVCEKTYYMGRECWHVIVSATNSSGWAGSYSSLSGFSSGYVGTRSCWVNFPAGQNRSGWYGCPFAFESCNVSATKNYDFNKMGTWQHCYCTATATSSSSNFLFYWFAINSGSARVEFYISDIQFENKDHATPYTPNTRADLIAYDCSGYNRNGTVTSSTCPIVVNGGGRNNKCYQFDGVNSSILIPFTSAIPEGIFTASMWFYKTTLSSEGYDTIFGGPSGFELETKQGSESTNVIWAYSWNKGVIPYTFNEWHHLVMVRTANDSKFYLDGELKFTGTAGSIPSGNYYIGSWRDYTSQNYKGKISDFRIYATTLSADDVARLYKTSASIDKSKRLHCYELVEE